MYFSLSGLLPASSVGEGGGQRQVSDFSEELCAEIHLPTGHLSGKKQWLKEAVTDCFFLFTAPAIKKVTFFNIWEANDLLLV